MSRLALLLGSAFASFAVSVSPAAVAPDSVTHRCKTGFRHAVIAGQHKCLKAGQRCTTRLDRQYHRYGFHCHTGRLTRVRPVLGSADVGVTVTDTPDPVVEGDPLTYTVTATNGGPDAAVRVRVTMEIAGSRLIEYESPDDSCGSPPGSGELVCGIGPLAAGGSETATLVVRSFGNQGTLTNRVRATADTPDPRSGNNEVTATTTVVPRPVPRAPSRFSASSRWKRDLALG